MRKIATLSAMSKAASKMVSPGNDSFHIRRMRQNKVYWLVLYRGQAPRIPHLHFLPTPRPKTWCHCEGAKSACGGWQSQSSRCKKRLLSQTQGAILRTLQSYRTSNLPPSKEGGEGDCGRADKMDAYEQKAVLLRRQPFIQPALAAATPGYGLDIRIGVDSRVLCKVPL